MDKDASKNLNTSKFTGNSHSFPNLPEHLSLFRNSNGAKLIRFQGPRLENECEIEKRDLSVQIPASWSHLVQNCELWKGPKHKCGSGMHWSLGVPS